MGVRAGFLPISNLSFFDSPKNDSEFELSLNSFKKHNAEFERDICQCRNDIQTDVAIELDRLN